MATGRLIVRRGLLSLLAPLLASTQDGCSASTTLHAQHARTEKEAELWHALEPGQRIVIYDGHKRCKASVAPTPALLDGGASPIGEQPWASKATVWTIPRSSVTGPSGDKPGYVTLRVQHPQIGDRAVRYTPDGTPGCIWPANPEVDKALPRVGKKLVFSPWKTSCSQIEATGTSPDAALLESEPPFSVTLDAVEIGPWASDKFAGGTWDDPVVVWYRANNGTLHLRGDTVSQCFAEPGSAEAAPPADTLSIVRMDPSRCVTESSGGSKHVECRTSLGVWEGLASGSALSLRLVRRTLGPFHLLDGKPVSGEKFARTVVAVRFAATTQEREKALYEAMNRVVATVLSGDDGLVRVAPVGDPAVTLPVSVGVHDLTLGELEKTSSQEQSEYEERKETRPNPEKKSAQDAAAAARQDLENARQDFQRRKDQERQNHEQCLNACGAISDANAQNTCRLGCGVVSAITAESDAAVIAAQNKVNEADAKVQNTPDTIEVPIMGTWNYTKTTYSRSVSAVLETVAELQSGPRKSSTRLADTVSDYDVEDDARHNVKGHRANREMMQNPSSLLPLIAEKISTQLATNLRTLIDQETQEAALRQFAQSGGEASRPEYKAVDATAFDTVGRRLRKALQRGVATLAPNTPTAIPSAAVPLSSGDCLLAVAVSDPSTPGSIALETVSGSHADLRGKSFALVEVCASELEPGSSSAGEIRLTAPQAAKVRWGLYLLSR